MPFSDPTADGPVIQRASERALQLGHDAARRARLRARMPRPQAATSAIVLFGYYNPLLAFGEEAVAARPRRRPASTASWSSTCRRKRRGSMLRGARAARARLRAAGRADHARRRASIASRARAGAFLYYVSLTGVTGAATDLERAGAARRRGAAAAPGMPVAVGFGVKTPDDVREASRSYADGVVVGSAVCRAIEAGEERRSRPWPPCASWSARCARPVARAEAFSKFEEEVNRQAAEDAKLKTASCTLASFGGLAVDAS